MSDNIIKTAIMYGKQNCPNCLSAKKLLENNNYTIEYIGLDDEDARKAFYERVAEEVKTPIMSVPQIWVNSQYIGGYQSLIEYIAVENSVKFDEEF